MKNHVLCWTVITSSTLLALGACQSAPTRIYPLLPAQPSVRISVQGLPIRVDAIHVPPEWDRIEILTPTSSGELKINDFDRWSAPLAQVMRQVLSVDLDARMPSGTVIYPHLPKPTTGALGINVDILEFTIGESQATMQASWIVTSGEVVQSVRRSAATFSDPLASTEPAAIAHAWSALAGQLADRIAADATSFNLH